MNHIQALTMKRKDLETNRDLAIQEIQDFRAFLQSAKFTTPSQDGSRVDWISTQDVNSCLMNLLDTLRGIA